MKQKLTRLDKYLTDKKIVPSRAVAQSYIEAGRVSVDGAVVTKCASLISPQASVAVDAPEREYVSRGAYKLLKAFESFDISAQNKICADIGASTGGFTEVLLSRGASRVWAVDVGYGQLAWKLRNDPRVAVLERTNARALTVSDMGGEKVDAVVSDASFISVKTLLPTLEKLLKDDGFMVILIKPQFEAGRERVGKGVVKSAAVHRDVLRETADFIENNTGLRVEAADYSPIKGARGNIEFLFLLKRKDGRAAKTHDFDKIVEEAHRGAGAHAKAEA